MSRKGLVKVIINEKEKQNVMENSKYEVNKTLIVCLLAIDLVRLTQEGSTQLTICQHPSQRCYKSSLISAAVTEFLLVVVQDHWVVIIVFCALPQTTTLWKGLRSPYTSSCHSDDDIRQVRRKQASRCCHGDGEAVICGRT